MKLILILPKNNEPNPGGIDFNISSLEICLRRFVFQSFDCLGGHPLKPPWCTKCRVKIQISYVYILSLRMGGERSSALPSNHVRWLYIFRTVVGSRSLLSLCSSWRSQWACGGTLLYSNPEQLICNMENECLDNGLSARRMWEWKHEGNHKKSESFNKVLILCRTFITQFQEVKVSNVRVIIGWGDTSFCLCSLSRMVRLDVSQ